MEFDEEDKYVYSRDEALSVQQLLSSFAGCLPQLVVAADGISFGYEMEISSGEVLLLHAVGRQDRALVHDAEGRLLSIPLDYRHLFSLTRPTPGAGEMLPLRDVVRLPLPVDVQFSKGGTLHFRNATAASMSRLTVVHVHAVPYLLARPVCRGILSPATIVLPAYLKRVSFCPVRGVQRTAQGDETTDQIVRLIDHHEKDTYTSVLEGEKEIFLLSRDYSNLDDSIDQNVYITVTRRSRHSTGNTDLRTFTRARPLPALPVRSVTGGAEGANPLAHAASGTVNSTGSSEHEEVDLSEGASSFYEIPVPQNEAKKSEVVYNVLVPPFKSEVTTASDVCEEAGLSRAGSRKIKTDVPKSRKYKKRYKAKTVLLQETPAEFRASLCDKGYRSLGPSTSRFSNRRNRGSFRYALFEEFFFKNISHQPLNEDRDKTATRHTDLDSSLRAQCHVRTDADAGEASSRTQCPQAQGGSGEDPPISPVYAYAQIHPERIPRTLTGTDVSPPPLPPRRATLQSETLPRRTRTRDKVESLPSDMPSSSPQSPTLSDKQVKPSLLQKMATATNKSWEVGRAGRVDLPLPPIPTSPDRTGQTSSNKERGDRSRLLLTCSESESASLGTRDQVTPTSMQPPFMFTVPVDAFTRGLTEELSRKRRCRADDSLLKNAPSPLVNNPSDNIYEEVYELRDSIPTTSPNSSSEKKLLWAPYLSPSAEPNLERALNNRQFSSDKHATNTDSETAGVQSSLAMTGKEQCLPMRGKEHVTNSRSLSSEDIVNVPRLFRSYSATTLLPADNMNPLLHVATGAVYRTNSFGRIHGTDLQVTLRELSLSAQMTSLSEMTISDVASVLKRLNLSKYADSFKEHLVDGVILEQLTTETLREDFQMSRLESIRLMTFIQRGHLPK